jgi:hypothetical protein
MLSSQANGLMEVQLSHVCNNPLHARAILSGIFALFQMCVIGDGLINVINLEALLE